MATRAINRNIIDQTADEISTQIHRSSVPSLVVHITACSDLLHKMAVRAINRKILSYWWDFNEISRVTYIVFGDMFL
jgi:hypothetical protein